jgi:hypothetical protein
VAISKANFNSFNVTPTASKFITFNSSNNGLAADDVGGALQLISTQTASSSASLSFTSGIDSTYKEYIFKFINIHPANDDPNLQMNFSIDGGSNYNVTKTTTVFLAYNDEADSSTSLEYLTSIDLAQSTAAQKIAGETGNANDECMSGTLHLFDPSNTTFVKHFIARTNSYDGSNLSVELHTGGYGNTTSAINAVQFSFSSGNIDSGVIKMYGVN